MEDILKRLRKGDISAFEEIVNYYDLKLFYIALARVKNETIAKEAVQDTFVTLYLNLKKLNNVENFNSWIIKVLINNCNKKFKKNKITEISYDEINAEVFMHDDENMKSVLDKMNFLEIISILNKDDRTLMVLYYKDEYTTKEISEILNMNENTIRTRIKRARDIIRKKIEGEVNGR